MAFLRHEDLAIKILKDNYDTRLDWERQEALVSRALAF